ncbi:hypothetical protein LTR84_002435 [Exophiala bonariae]|uniref:Uncharacterized protein n=1 Tax=Exophiala bonariae TaxID=1690606 RepID=A0AAV9N9N7_9EURO|nr:hypothetical protein LTR84_002435 [Exophiala bonariae]
MASAKDLDSAAISDGGLQSERGSDKASRACVGERSVQKWVDGIDVADDPTEDDSDNEDLRIYRILPAAHRDPDRERRSAAPSPEARYPPSPPPSPLNN